MRKCHRCITSQTSKEQMKPLKDVFVRTSSFTKLTLWRKLFNLKSGTNESLEDHFLKFDTIIRDLKDLGSTIDETDRVCHLLLSLPSQYDTVITALETVSEVKMDFIKAPLLDEELKHKCKNNVEQSSGNDFSLKVSTGCFICGNKSHFKAQCPKRFNRGRYNRGRNRRGRFNNVNQEKEQANSAKESISLVAANFCNQKDLISNKVFALDSGASNHFVKLDDFDYDNCNVVLENNNLWHRRLGHAGKDALQQLGLPIPIDKCSTCIEAKATRLPFNKI
ncbi:hypothetical protein QE152_g7435 [Popillia japonica]|uniref:CCHC-type domain-containing protein n=1 Tax=Popillia japonica TaxID=7064 RepID=A0AAW1MDR1_POPJA